jgi:hypothetical protein
LKTFDLEIGKDDNSRVGRMETTAYLTTMDVFYYLGGADMKTPKSSWKTKTSSHFTVNLQLGTRRYNTRTIMYNKIRYVRGLVVRDKSPINWRTLLNFFVLNTRLGKSPLEIAEKLEAYNIEFTVALELKER